MRDVLIILPPTIYAAASETLAVRKRFDNSQPQETIVGADQRQIQDLRRGR
jgi:hypothetical protein